MMVNLTQHGAHAHYWNANSFTETNHYSMVIFDWAMQQIVARNVFRVEQVGTEGRHWEKKQAEENETAYRKDSVFRCSYS